MNIIQRKSTAKYLYDISKGVALVAVLGAFIQQEWSISRISSGVIATIIIFFAAYFLEGRLKNE